MKKDFNLTRCMKETGDKKQELENELARIIREAEGRAAARTITVQDIMDMIDAAEAHLFRFSTKKDAVGTRISVDVNAQNFPRSYKYIPESTHFAAELRPSGWFLTCVSREITRGPGRKIVFTFTEATIRNMPEFLSMI